MREISAYLRQRDLHVKLIYSHQAYLDILPIRASKGLAVRYIAMKWGITPDRILVAGDSGNDEEMLKGNTLGVVVGNYSKELSKLKGRERIYFAEQPFAHGVIEGMEHYDFLNDIEDLDAGSNWPLGQGQTGD
jgi:sucrose-phosphate synthase